MVCLATESLWVPGGTAPPCRNSIVRLSIEKLFKQIYEEKGWGMKTNIMHEWFVLIRDIVADDVWCCSCPRCIGLVPRKNGIGLGLPGIRATRVACKWTWVVSWQGYCWSLPLQLSFRLDWCFGLGPTHFNHILLDGYHSFGRYEEARKFRFSSWRHDKLEYFG